MYFIICLRAIKIKASLPVAEREGSAAKQVWSLYIFIAVQSDCWIYYNFRVELRNNYRSVLENICTQNLPPTPHGLEPCQIKPWMLDTSFKDEKSLQNRSLAKTLLLFQRYSLHGVLLKSKDWTREGVLYDLYRSLLFKTNREFRCRSPSNRLSPNLLATSDGFRLST